MIRRERIAFYMCIFSKFVDEDGKGDVKNPQNHVNVFYEWPQKGKEKCIAIYPKKMAS